MPSRTHLQRAALVALRTLIGWHFLYEGYYKLMMPAWSRAGQRLPEWTASGYLSGATGPFAHVFHVMGAPPFAVWVDRITPPALVAIGLMLMLGLFTQIACWGALSFLAMFYVSMMPLHGLPQSGAEGTYLLVDKNLVEASAVAVLIAFRTGSIAGLDLLWLHRVRGNVEVTARG